MKTSKNPFSRIVRALVTSELSLAQVVLAVSSIVHAAWLIFPQWIFTFRGSSVSGAPRLFEDVIAVVLAITGVFMIIAVRRKKDEWIRLASLLQSMVWIFITGLAIMASSLTGILWIGYATITLLSMAIYLSSSARLWVDNDE